MPIEEQPEHGSGQGYDDTIAPAFDGTPVAGLKNTDGAEPAHHVVNKRMIGGDFG